MRYADGGGLTARARARREAVRIQAAQMFAQGTATRQVASRLRVSANSVRVWRRRWQSGGVAALASKGPPGAACRLDEAQLTQLMQALKAGPAAHGFTDDQRWTLARVADLVTKLFGVDYTLRGVSYLLHRIGWSPQVPVHRAVERDEEAITTWIKETWPAVKSPRRPLAPGSALRTSQASR